MPDDTTLPALPQPPHPQPPQPVTRDAEELRETLDLLGIVVASLSDRVDAQTATLERLTKTAAETRAAAFHAKSQMDMAPVAAALSESMDRNIGPLANALSRLQRDIETDRAMTKRELEGFLHSTSDVLDRRRRQIEGLQARNWIPLTAVLGLVLVLSTGFLAPWAMARVSGELICWLADGFWFVSSQSCGL